jgi:MFS family permease
MTSVLIRHSPPDKLGRNMSIGLGAGVLGVIIGPVIAGPLVKMHWWVFDLPFWIDRPLWLAFAFSTFVFVLATAWFWTSAGKDKVAGAHDPNVSTVQKVLAADGLVASGPGPTTGVYKKPVSFLDGVLGEFKVILRFAKNPLFLGLIAPLFFCKLIMCAWQVLLFPHVKELGIVSPDSPASAVEDAVGRFMVILAGAFIVMTLPSGYLSDRMSARRLSFVALLGVVATLVVMGFVKTGVSFGFIFAGYACASAVLIPVHLKMVGEVYQTEESHGRIFGIVHALSDLGMILGPAFIWLYVSSGFGRILTFVIMAGLGFLTIPAFMYSKGREKDLPRP